MSYDFATAKICSHEVVFEALTLDLDHRTANLVKPPSSKRAEVYVNKQKIPENGLYSFATVTTTAVGPFNIVSGKNDMLQIAADKDDPITLKLPIGRITPAHMMEHIKSLIPESINISITKNRITFSSRIRTQRTSFAFPDPRWVDKISALDSTARILGGYKELGIVPGRSVYGKLMYPGWTIETNITSPDGMDKHVFFKEPLANNAPLVQVSYVTFPQFCRRCGGTQLEFDYTVKNGSYEIVRNTDLLAQEFDKFLHTDLGSHWKWNWLGSGLNSRIGGKGSSGKINITSLLNADVTQAFATYQNIKQQQDTRFPQQKVTDSEYPLQLSDVSVRLDPLDPTIAMVGAVITSRDRKFVPIRRDIGSSSPIRLIGDDSSPGFLSRGT